jgi:hypothetical protein
MVLFHSIGLEGNYAQTGRTRFFPQVGAGSNFQKKKLRAHLRCVLLSVTL